MKSTLLSICLITLFAACSSSKSDPEPTNSSLLGEWSISSKSLTGNFKIVDYNGTGSTGLFINTTSDGAYTYSGKKTIIWHESEVKAANGKVTQLILYGPDTNLGTPNTPESAYVKNTFIQFAAGDYSSDFKTMTFKSYTKGPEATVTQETVTITRTK